MKKIFCFIIVVGVILSKTFYVYADTAGSGNLTEILGRALAVSDILKLEEKNIEEARNYLKLQYSNYFPKLSVQASANTDLLRTNDFDKDRDTSLSLVLDWDMFGNGQIAYSIASAKSKLLKAKIAKRTSESELIYNITCDYLDLFLSEYNKINLEKKMEVFKGEIEQADIAFQQGNIDRVSLTRKRIKFSDSAIEHSQASYSLVSLSDKLQTQTKGSVSVSAGEINSLIAKINNINFDQYKIYQMALVMEPDYLMLQQAHDMAYLAQKYAKYKRFPQVQFFTGNSFAVDSFDRDNNQVELRTGMIVRYHLFDGGKIKYEIAQAKKNYERVSMEFDAYKGILKKDIADLCFAIDKNKKVMQLSEQKLNLLKDDIDNTENEYKKGNISRHKWNTLLMEYEKSRLKDFALKTEYLISVATLFKKLGNFSIVKTDDFAYHLESCVENI